MKLVRHGNINGLDTDYKVYVDSFDEVETLHKELLNKGYLFTHRKGSLPYEPFDTFTVLHYIDKKLGLFDFAIMFPKTNENNTVALQTELSQRIDKVYKDAKTNPELRKRLMLYMKHYTRLMAFVKYMNAYNKEQLDGEYKDRFNKELQYIKKDVIEIDNTEPTVKNIKKIREDIFRILLPEY